MAWDRCPTEGGDVRICARIADGRLRLSVADTGCGLTESSGAGVGRANSRSRLRSMYGGRTRLALVQNPRRDVTATIELPVSESTLVQAMP